MEEIEMPERGKKIIILHSIILPGRGYRARSKVRDLGSRPVGVRGFESLPLHFEIEIHKFDII